MCLFWCQLGYFVFGITYCFLLYLGLPYFLGTKSFEVVSLVGVLWMHSCVVYLCDGELDVLVFAVTRWKMLHYFLFCSHGWQLLCVASFRGHWALANLFLLHRWVPTLIMWGSVGVTWFYWEWGHFEIYACTCDLAFMFSFCWTLLFALNICDGSYDLDFWQSWKLVVVVA